MSRQHNGTRQENVVRGGAQWAASRAARWRPAGSIAQELVGVTGEVTARRPRCSVRILSTVMSLVSVQEWRRFEHLLTDMMCSVSVYECLFAHFLDCLLADAYDVLIGVSVKLLDLNQ